MAEDPSPATSLIGGLNDIVGFASTGDEGSGGRRFGFGMDKTSSSRIPKLGFGFRKPARGKTGTQSEGNSPRGMGVARAGLVTIRPMTPTDTHSAPGSNNTSPNLSRSKSLRVPRSTYQSLKSRSSSSILEQNQDSDDGEEETAGKGVLQRIEAGEQTASKFEVTYLPRPRSKTIVGGFARSSLRSSCRSVSPRTALGGKGRGRAEEGEDDEEDDTMGSPQPEDSVLFRRDRRTKSFSVKNRSQLTNGSLSSTTSTTSSSSSSPANAISRASSMRRSKTPTSLISSVRSNYIREHGTGGGNGQEQKGSGGLVRTGSQGHVGKYNTRLAPPSQQEKVPLRKTDPASKPPRPQSSYVSENATPPLDSSRNKSSLGMGGTGKRAHSSMGYNQVMRDRTPSPTATTAITQNSQQPGTGRVTPTRTSRYLITTKSRTPSLEDPNSGSNNRPRSATAYYQQQGRRQSLSKESKQDCQPDSAQNRRESTPSSGRSTPVQQRSGGKERTDGGVMSSTAKVTSALPPRTPYRVARTKAAPSNDLAGMNELEGSVLLEADDYRRLFNEVKALKTALLKLKRELQDGSQSDTTPSQSSHVGRSRTSPLPGQMSSADYNKKLKAVGKERDAISDDVIRLKKDNRSKDARIETLTRELAQAHEEQKETSEELQRVSEQRDRHVEKVERLHAEKHQVEARLNTLERASIYEQTWSDNWLDELDGEGDEALRESLEKGQRSFTEGGRKKGSIGSDIVDSGMQSDGDVEESSEPEGMSISYAMPSVM